MEETAQHGVAIPFGQYKGHCALCVAQRDPGYAQWCLSQEGMAERYPDVIWLWADMGIRPKVKCSAATAEGTPCHYWAKHGPLCGQHYRQAERAMMKAVDEMAGAWEI